MDRVISISVGQLFEIVYVVSAKMMDIQDGSIISTKSVDHEGSLKKLRYSLKILAKKLTRKLHQKTSVEVIQPDKKTKDYVVFDKTTGLVWQKNEPSKMNWFITKNYCSSLSLDGHSDWRLPRIKELRTAFQIKSKFLGFVHSNYWSSTSADNINGPWFDFINFTNGMISHQSTGLIWQQDSATKEKNWKSAKKYCNSLSLGGYSDWCLPEVMELYTLVDYTFNYPSINTKVFPKTNSDYYWTSTTYRKDRYDMWSIGFMHGSVTYFNGGAPLSVRCVRDGQ